MKIEDGMDYLISHSDQHGDLLYHTMVSPDITYVS